MSWASMYYLEVRPHCDAFRHHLVAKLPAVVRLKEKRKVFQVKNLKHTAKQMIHVETLATSC